MASARSAFHQCSFQRDLVLAAADAVLKRIERDKETMYPRLFELSERLRDGLVRVIRDAGFHCFGQGIGPLFQVFIGDSDIDRLYNYRDTVGYVRNDIFSAFHEELQKRGHDIPVYLGMRHWSPWIEDIVGQMIDDGITQAVSIVLAPHYSKMSVAKYQQKVQEMRAALHNSGPDPAGSAPCRSHPQTATFVFR